MKISNFVRILTSIPVIYLFGVALWFILGFALFLPTVNAIEENSSSKAVVCANSCRSSDGKYEAIRAGSHYEIKETDTGKLVLTTHDKFGGPNDVKGGLLYLGQSQKRSKLRINTVTKDHVRGLERGI